MKLLKHPLGFLLALIVALVLSSLVLNHVSFAAQVQACKKIKQSKKLNGQKAES